MADRTPGARPNRNMLWLLGVLAAFIVVVVLALNSRGSNQSGAQVEGAVSAQPGPSSAQPGAPAAPS